MVKHFMKKIFTINVGSKNNLCFCILRISCAETQLSLIDYQEIQYDDSLEVDFYTMTLITIENIILI